MSNQSIVEPPDTGAPLDIPPLTRNNKYLRLSTTVRHIRSVVDLRGTALLDRFRVSDESDPAYLGPEALAFFVRRHRQDNDPGCIAGLLDILVLRCISALTPSIRGFDEDTRVDIQQDILTRLVALLLDDSDKSDFMQVRFWVVLKRLRLSACGKYLNYVSRTDQLDDEQAETGVAQRDHQISPEQLAQLTEGLAALDPHLRQVFVMRHYQNWKIGPERREEEDPDDPSLAGYFGKTPRTIQNWLKKADDALARFRKD